MRRTSLVVALALTVLFIGGASSSQYLTEHEKAIAAAVTDTRYAPTPEEPGTFIPEPNDSVPVSTDTLTVVSHGGQTMLARCGNPIVMTSMSTPLDDTVGGLGLSAAALLVMLICGYVVLRLFVFKKSDEYV